MISARQNPRQSIQKSVFYTRFRGLEFLEEILVGLTILKIACEEAKSFLYIKLPSSEKSENEGIIRAKVFWGKEKRTRPSLRYTEKHQRAVLKEHNGR